jgi:hypothetical protein
VRRRGEKLAILRHDCVRLLIELKGWPCGDAPLQQGIGRRLAPWAMIERRAPFCAGFGARRTAAQRPTAIMGFWRVLWSLLRACFDAFFSSAPAD